MISFIISLVALVLGYLVYGAVMERVMRPDDRETPAVRLADGVDYVALPTWKVFMIQFLNIAGTGPIFGAIMGMWFGPASYLWIVLGCIFAGAVHDFMSGMLSLRHDGANLPTLIGKYLGNCGEAMTPPSGGLSPFLPIMWSPHCCPSIKSSAASIPCLPSLCW